jgi:hypothetical protein
MPSADLLLARSREPVRRHRREPPRGARARSRLDASVRVPVRPAPAPDEDQASAGAQSAPTALLRSRKAAVTLPLSRSMHPGTPGVSGRTDDALPLFWRSACQSRAAGPAGSGRGSGVSLTRCSLSHRARRSESSDHDPESSTLRMASTSASRSKRWRSLRKSTAIFVATAVASDRMPTSTAVQRSSRPGCRPATADPVGDQRPQVRGRSGRAGPHHRPRSATSAGAESDTVGLGPHPGGFAPRLRGS